MTSHRLQELQIKYIINQLKIIVVICVKQPASYQCNDWHDFYTVLARALYEANTENYKALGGKNQGVQESQYFTVLTGPIFYSINRSMRL